jgi:ferritin-like metal-binding protein YciE
MAKMDESEVPLHKLFVEELQDLYSAERQLVKALPKMAEASTSPELKKVFQDHLKETEGQVERLDKVFESIEEEPGDETCEAMEGLVEESEKLIDLELGPDVLDAALIAAAQKVEHYEIASYGTVCTWAKLMGHKEALSELKATLSEEKKADELLSKLAANLNKAALAPAS